MKFDCQNWQISICSGNPLNISFNLFDMKYFQRKLMISGKSTNTSFHLFDWMYFQRKLMISGNSSNQTTFHLFDWDWDLFPLKQWKELFFQDKYLYCSHFLKKAVCPKFPFKFTNHQNFLWSAPLTKSGSFAALGWTFCQNQHLLQRSAFQWRTPIGRP